MKFILFFFYIFLFFGVVILLASSSRARSFFMDVHKSKDNKNISWTRLGGTFALYMAIGLYVYKATFGIDIDEYVILSIIALVLTGKITQSIFNKDN